MFWTPPNVAGRAITSLTTAAPSETVGTTITNPGSANTKGSWVQLISVMPYAANMLSVCISETQTSGGGVNDGVVVDIGVGTGGSYNVVIPDLLCSRLKASASGLTMPMQIIVPMRIEKGMDVAARLQSTSTTRTARVAVWATIGSSVPIESFVGCDAIGITTSGGTAGTAHTPGNSGTFSSWASVGSTTSRDYKATMIVVDGEAATSTNLLYYVVEFGYNSRSPLIGMVWAMTTAAEERFGGHPAYPSAIPVPSGTQLQVRATCSGTAEVQNVGLYCFY